MRSRDIRECLRAQTCTAQCIHWPVLRTMLYDGQPKTLVSFVAFVCTAIRLGWRAQAHRCTRRSQCSQDIQESGRDEPKKFNLFFEIATKPEGHSRCRSNSCCANQPNVCIILVSIVSHVRRHRFNHEKWEPRKPKCNRKLSIYQLSQVRSASRCRCLFNHFRCKFIKIEFQGCNEWFIRFNASAAQFGICTQSSTQGQSELWIMKNLIFSRTLHTVTKTDRPSLHPLFCPRPNYHFRRIDNISAIEKLRNWISLLFELSSYFFTARQGRERKRFMRLWLTVRMKKVTVFLCSSFAPSLCLRNCLCERKRTLARYLPRRDIFPSFFLHKLSFRRQRTHTNFIKMKTKCWTKTMEKYT